MTGDSGFGSGSDGGSETGGKQRTVFTGPVIIARDEYVEDDFGDADAPGTPGGLAGTLAAAGVRGRQLLEIVSGAIRGVAAVLRFSAVAGLAAALVITLIWDPAFDMRWWKALILLGILALPALEVLAHRAVLMRLWGDPKRLENRARTGSRSAVGSVVGGADDFARRMAALGKPRAAGGVGGAARGRAGLGAARSALGLRDVAGAIPGVAGLLLFPLRKGLLGLTAVCTGLCWVLLVIGVPVGVLVGLGAALAR